jgi:hypothetical protein
MAKQPMYVYISHPTAHAAPPVVDSHDASDLLFNLPCTIAGGEDTLAIESQSPERILPVPQSLSYRP